jgi:hypothetical protein
MLYINYNISRIKKFIKDVGLFWAIGLGILYLAIGTWILGGEDINSTTLFIALMTWVLFEIYSRVTYANTSSPKNNLIDKPINPNIFYDVVAREIFAQREQLTNLAIKQDSLGWDKFFSEEFIYKMRLYPRYKKHYLKNCYTPPGKKIGNEWGCIILIVGEDIFGDIITHDSEKMDIETLIKLHNGLEKSEHKTFHKGSFIYLYLEEKDVHEDSDRALEAEILCINKSYDIYYIETKITLKIDLNSDRDPYPGCDDPEPEYITRTIRLIGNDHFFIDDDKINGSK